MQRIADATGFPLKYFFKEPKYSTGTMSQIPLYRGSPSKTESLKRSYEIATNWSSEVVDFLKNYVVLLDVNLLDGIEFDPFSKVDTLMRIEEVADKVRRHWHLGKGPIYDLVGILGNH